MTPQPTDVPADRRQPALVTYVATVGDLPTNTALTLEAAQRDALRAEKQFRSAAGYEYRWEQRGRGEWRLMSRCRERGGRFSWTQRSVYATAFTPDEKTTPVDGPFPVKVCATPSGAVLDVSGFLVKAVFPELITRADDDPEALVTELADLADLLRSAVHGGRNSHARHEFDGCMQRMAKEYANDGVIPVYGDAVARLASRLAEIAAPRPVPGQRTERGAA